jgi:uncharacterized membrane protein YhiD involved in acid resistance
MDLTAPAPLSLPTLLLNLILGLILSIFVAWYYKRFGQSLSNRTRFAPILPMLTLITLLVISVVKSSLALSLGLVGALSIVRFRTAIKDPEELIYLFFAISIGLGLGADQRVPTVAAAIVILLYLVSRKISQKSFGRRASHSLYLNITMESEEAGSSLFSKINNLLLEELPQVDLRRMDNQGNQLQVTYYISVHEQGVIAQIMDNLTTALPGCSLSIVEQNNLLGG